MAVRDWKSESVTNLLTNQLTYLPTWVGARDTCVSKKFTCVYNSQMLMRKNLREASVLNRGLARLVNKPNVKVSRSPELNLYILPQKNYAYYLRLYALFRMTEV